MIRLRSFLGNRFAPWVLGAVAVAVLATGALMFLQGDPESVDEQVLEEEKSSSMTTQRSLEQTLLSLEALGYDVLTDTDGDGLPDVVENFIYGSDPNAFSTTGNSIPDGWFARYGFDPTIPGIENTPAATPPAQQLPGIYNGIWPNEYSWTLKDVYFWDRPDNWPADTFWDNGVNPTQWESASGIPKAWLYHHDLPIKDPGIADASLTDDGFTVKENYEHDTDPRLLDTDGDGLSDRDEVLRYGTDPTRFSTVGSGIPDGWLVFHGLDPLDPGLATSDPAGKGLTVLETWGYNEGRFGMETALTGHGLDPTQMSYRDDAIPDGWLVGHDLDPLDETITMQVVQCASDYEDVRHLAPDDTPQGMDPLPDLCLTIEDAYRFKRPDDWQEVIRGPWPHGLDPNTPDQDEDGLPDAIEIRGWYVERSVEPGPGARSEWIHVTSDPFRTDTDGDGLTDYEEYHGRVQKDGNTYAFPLTDPSNPDTAFSGMSDAEKVFARFDGVEYQLHEQMDDGSLRPLLDPTRMDTAGDFLADGDAMQFWSQAEENARTSVPYNTIYPHSNWDSYEQWMENLDAVQEALNGQPLTRELAARFLAPDGDIDGDGVPNIVDPSASGDGLLNGWQVHPELLRYSDFPHGHPRLPTDPANPDTSGDRLPDAWKLRWGQWDPQIGTHGGWDLDPAKYDSNGDGVSDGDGNLDGDVVSYHVYTAGGPQGFQVEPRTFPFTNILEYDAGTNPRMADENFDGVTEGWVYFWGRIYPSLVENSEAGDRVPTSGELEKLLNEEGRFNNLLAETGTIVKDTVEYMRFVVLEGPPEIYLDPARKEVLDRETTITLDGEPVKIGSIRGTYEHTHEQDQRWGLNPYLRDTDGDGVPDAWKAYYASHYRQECSADFHPAQPSALVDHDGDGLTNRDEYELREIHGFGTNPCLADTNLNRLEDGTAVALGLNPLAPGDLADPTSNEDSSGDGIPDWQKLTRGLDPLRPDTASSGLLDGQNRCLNPNDPVQLERIIQWQELGIAHRWVEGQSHPLSECWNRVEFIGSESVNADPRTQDTSGDGIPDGWLAYNGRSVPIEQPVSVQQRYACAKPDWWQEDRLGTWWWGLRAVGGDTTCPRDRDFDGLDDYNGEDPFPAVSQSNDPPTGWGVLPEAMDDPSIQRGALLRLGQGYGECAGDPRSCFDQWQTRWQEQLHNSRVPVQVIGLEYGLDGEPLWKEDSFTVSGRLVASCGEDPCDPMIPIPNRTVTLRIHDPSEPDPLHYRYDDGRTIGVGFTDAEGVFTVAACLCSDGGEVTVPVEGIVALGAPSGNVSWSTAAVSVPPGSGLQIGVHAYATTATFYNDPQQDPTHPQWLDIEIEGQQYTASRPGWALGDPVTVASETRLTFNVPDSVEWSQEPRLVPVSIQLLDASGRPLEGRALDLTIQPALSVPDELTTNAEGRVAVDLPVPEGLLGKIALHATFQGSSDGLELGAEATAEVVLQAPLSLVIDAPDTPQRIGTSFEFAVSAVSSLDGKPVSGVELRPTIGATSLPTNTTDPAGTATFKATLSGVEPGQITLRVVSTPAKEWALAFEETQIQTVTGSLLISSLPEEAEAGRPVHLTGRLTLSDGTGIVGSRLEVRLDGTLLDTFTTTPHGRFDGPITIPTEVAAGSRTLSLEYEGVTNTIDASRTEAILVISVPTRIVLEDTFGTWDQPLSLTGRLEDAAGRPLAGHWLNITMPQHDPVTLLSGSNGTFFVEYTPPADLSLGRHPILITYNGSPNGTYSPTSTEVDLVLGAPTFIHIDDPSVFERGDNRITGRFTLQDQDTPIGEATIQLETDWGYQDTVTTQTDGSFTFLIPVTNEVSPGALRLEFGFEGTESHGPHESNTTVLFNVPTRLALTVPSEAGRGAEIQLQLALLDDTGQGIPHRNLTLSLFDGQRVLETGDNGTTQAVLPVPPETPYGTTRLTLEFHGEPAYRATQETREILVKDGVRIHIEGPTGNLMTGQSIEIRIHLETTTGQPLSEHDLAVQVEGHYTPIFTVTDHSGNARVPITVPLSDRLGVAVSFPGTESLAATITTWESESKISAQSTDQQVLRSGALLTIGALLLVLAGGGYLLARHIVRSGPVAILQHSRSQIEAGDPWSAAVLLAYQQLSAHMQDEGLKEQDAQTPRSFAQVLVDAKVLGEDAAIEFVSLVERARYANEGEMDPQDAATARLILDRAIQSAGRLHSGPLFKATGGVRG